MGLPLQECVLFYLIGFFWWMAMVMSSCQPYHDRFYWGFPVYTLKTILTDKWMFIIPCNNIFFCKFINSHQFNVMQTMGEIGFWHSVIENYPFYLRFRSIETFACKCDEWMGILFKNSLVIQEYKKLSILDTFVFMNNPRLVSFNMLLRAILC